MNIASNMKIQLIEHCDRQIKENHTSDLSINNNNDFIIVDCTVGFRGSLCDKDIDYMVNLNGF